VFIGVSTSVCSLLAAKPDSEELEVTKQYMGVRVSVTMSVSVIMSVSM
jgi:hypothetical protein